MLTVVVGAWLVATPLVQPLGPLGNASSEFLVVSDPGFIEVPAVVRLTGGYESVGVTDVDRLDMLWSGVSATTRLGSRFSLDGTFRSTTVLDQPLLLAPEEFSVRVRTALPDFPVTGWAASLSVGGAFASDLRFGHFAPGKGAAHLGFSTGVATEAAGWAAEVVAGYGIDRQTDAEHEIPIAGATGVWVALPFWGARASLEGSTLADLGRPNGRWSIVGATGVSVPLTSFLRVYANATVVRPRRGELRVGGLLAISGGFGSDDMDADGVIDTEDACPGTRGAVEHLGCSFEDADQDGIWDRLDACPDEAGSPLNAGCVLADTNDNGIPDVDDPCPFREDCSDSPSPK